LVSYPCTQWPKQTDSEFQNQPIRNQKLSQSKVNQDPNQNETTKYGFLKSNIKQTSFSRFGLNEKWLRKISHSSLNFFFISSLLFCWSHKKTCVFFWMNQLLNSQKLLKESENIFLSLPYFCGGEASLGRLIQWINRIKKA
jgi:hypothetical protein